MGGRLDEALSEEYRELFATCKIQADRLAAIDAIIERILRNKAKYEEVGGPLGVPWHFVAALHNLESSLDFASHLHNGDPLTDRTLHVPEGRPEDGTPPFTWEASALDALEMKHLDLVENWSIPGLLFQFERFNGFGYRTRRTGVNSPYLWSFSNHYSKGKFVADGVFDAEKVSRQCGAAVLIRRLADTKRIDLKAFELSAEPVAVAAGRAGSSAGASPAGTNADVMIPTPDLATYRVIAAGLNVRSGPSRDANVVGTLDQADLVVRRGHSPDGQWYAVLEESSGLSGWSSARYLQRAEGLRPVDFAAMPWMSVARAELGTREMPGPGSNKRVLEYLATTTLDSAAKATDATPWCSAFTKPALTSISAVFSPAGAGEVPRRHRFR